MEMLAFWFWWTLPAWVMGDNGGTN